MAVQLARARGARVIGTAGEGNHEFLRALGAEPTTYGDGLVQRVRELAPEHGVRISTGGGERAWDALGQAARLSEAGEFTLPVARVCPFEQAPEAHRISEDGHVRGKLVLVPG